MEGAEKYHRSIDPSGESSVAQLVRWIPQGAKVLEMGPATGVMTKLLSGEKQCDVTCIEVDVSAAEAARGWCSRMIVADLNAGLWEEALGEERFDFITFADVLEHLLDPQSVLERSLKFLKSDGHVLISVPNIGYVGVIAELLEGRFDYRRDGLLDETHTHFFTRHSLVELLGRVGLKGLEWSRTCIAPEFSEFRVNMNRLGSHARQTLAAVPDGDTYQFLVRSSRTGVPPVLAIPHPRMSSQRLILSQIFFDTGGGFSEGSSVSIPLSNNDTRQKISARTPVGTRAIRIDLVDAELPVLLFAIRLSCEGRELLSWKSTDGAVSENCGLINSKEISIGALDLLLPTNNDPALVFSELEVNQVDVECEFSLEVSDAITEIVNHVDQQRALNTLRGAQIRDLESYQSLLAENLKKATAAVQSSQTKVASLEAEKSEQSARITELTEAYRVVSNDLLAMRDCNQALDSEKRHLAAIASELRHELTLAESELATARSTFQEVISSTSWKVTHPVRRVSELLRGYRARMRDVAASTLGALFVRLPRLLDNRLGASLFRSFQLGSDYDMRMVLRGPSSRDLARFRKQAMRWPSKPKFSVLMPTYKTHPRWLKDAIESVREQTYDDWELCIADDASDDPGVRSILSTYAANEPRIKVTFLADNGHISRASNEALKLVTGDYVILLDHDDVLAPHAFHKLAKTIIADPSLDILYSDEDKISLQGRRYEPTCKPSWSPEYFLSFMYTGHISCFRASLIKRVGGFREGFEGSQDYDLMLRLTELTDKVCHIPEILYHWRAHEQSVAGNLDSKPYAFQAAKRALKEALVRRGFPQASIRDSKARGLYLVDRHSQAKVAAVVSLFTQQGSVEIDGVTVPKVCVDDEASAVHELLSYRDRKGELVALITSRSSSSEDLMRLLNHAAERSVGVVAPLLVDANQVIRSAGMSILDGEIRPNFKGLQVGDIGYRGRLAIPFNVSLVAPIFLVFRAELLGSISGATTSLAELVLAICLEARLRSLRCVVDSSVVVVSADEAQGFEALTRRRVQACMKARGFVQFRDPFLPAGLLAYTGNAEMPPR